jgi:hypothetical protein
MESGQFDGLYGKTVTLDLCHGCAALWFDGEESLGLTPGAILRLFAIVGDHPGAAHRPWPDRLACPRCQGRLIPTTDLQRATRFAYWRCRREHGRFIAFVDFLREKNFVRPLGPRELEALRRNIRMIACSGCGAPIDLARTSVCGYCRAPVSTLDAEQVSRVVRELREAEEKRRTVDPALPLRLLHDRLEVERIFNRLRPDVTRLGLPASPDPGVAVGLVEAGLDAVARWLKGDD